MIQYAHCDEKVLHAPEDNCKHCNSRPELQELRVAWKINFTGHYDPDKQICPSERDRPLNQINKWYGNVPFTPEVEKMWDDFYKQREIDIQELIDKHKKEHWGG